ncbi:MAG: GNAT family N-acetyltransferase [Rubrivivax sp.]
MPPSISHNAAASRFETSIDGQLGVCTYRLQDGVLWLTHTEVPPQAQGQGHAAALVKATLDWAREQGHLVRPLCSYVALYMRRHPETQDLLAR